MIATLGYGSTSCAQSMQSYDSAVYWCVDREHIKRIRNYPCGDQERNVDQVNFRSTIVTFDKGGTRAVTEPLPSIDRMALQKEIKAKQQDVCGLPPKKPRENYSKDPNGRRMVDDLDAHIKAVTAYDVCTLNVMQTTARVKR